MPERIIYSLMTNFHFEPKSQNIEIWHQQKKIFHFFHIMLREPKKKLVCWIKTYEFDKIVSKENTQKKKNKIKTTERKKIIEKNTVSKFPFYMV